MLVGVKVRRGQQNARHRANLRNAVHAHDEQHQLERRFSIEQTQHAIEALHAARDEASTGGDARADGLAQVSEKPSAADLMRGVCLPAVCLDAVRTRAVVLASP